MPLLLALAAFSVPAAAAERRYSVTDFDRIQVDGPFDVTLSTGGTSQATVIGDQAGIDRVSLEVQGRTLRIRPNRAAWGGYPGDRKGSAPVRIVLSTRALRSATVLGAGSLSVDRVSGLRLDFSVSGSGSLALGSVEADTLIVGLIGSGTIRAGGRAKQLRIAVEGSGDFDGRALTGEDTNVVAGSSGTLVVGAVRTAKVTALGRGQMEILGRPACTLSGPAAALVSCGN